MRTRTTLILLALVAGLLTYIFTYERHLKSTDEKAAGGPLLDVDPASVESIEIRNASGDAKLKKRADGIWNLTAPFDDRVDPAFIEGVLSLCQKTELAEIVTERPNDEDRKSYGLDDASAIQVNFRKEGKSLAKIKIGKPGAMSQTTYAELPGHETQRGIYLFWSRVGQDKPLVRDILSRPISEMRDPWLLPFKLDKVVRFAIRGNNGEMEFSRERLNDKETTPWQLTKPLKARGEQKMVDEFAGLLCNSQVISLYPPNSPPPGADKDKAAADLTFWDKSAPDAKGFVIKFFPDPDPASKTINGYLGDRKAWFKIDAEYLQILPESPNSLRSHTLADLDPEKVTTVKIESRIGGTIQLYKINGNWLLRESETTWRAANSETVVRAITAMNKAEISEFTTDSLTNPAEYGLDQPIMSVTFGSGVHDSMAKLAPLTPENSLTIRFGTLESGERAGRLYANFVGQPSVFTMLPEHYNIIPRKALHYRDTGILSFNPLSVRRLKQTSGVEPPVELTRPPQSLEWTAMRAGSDVGKFLNKIAAERLVSKLAHFRASEWIDGLTEGAEALRNPALQIELDVEFQEDANAAPQTKTVNLNFAPAGNVKTALFYIGRCTDIPEYFYIDREMFKDLQRPLLEPK